MRLRFFASMIMVCALAVSSAPALAETVHLDGVDNATWYANPTTYLYVVNNTPGPHYGEHYYTWNYGDSLPLPWATVNALSQDLIDNHKDWNWKVESGGDPFNNPNVQNPWVTKHLGAGTYTLKLTVESEAYNLRYFTWGGTTDPDLGSKVWNAYVQIYAEGVVDTSFGGGDETYRQTSMQEALDYYRAHVDGMTMTLASDADVHFYINDCNSIDNGFSVTLEYTRVPLPGSLALLGPGLALLLAGGLWRRKRS